MISIDNITCKSKERVLFKNIGFSVLPSAIVKISGKNGSGKTTLLRILAGIQKPDSGEISRSQKIVGYLGHNIGVKDDITVADQLIFWATLFGNELLIEIAIRYLQLDGIVDEYCYNLSSGNKQKVGIARLIISNADIWILDEADTSLDKQNLELFKNLILTKVQNGGIVIYASHRDFLPCSFTLELDSIEKTDDMEIA
jgi:heme exporter protein A